MLQQTQVDTVIPFFDRFVAAFPDLRALAAAPLDKVLKLWEGLGYYARSRNLHKAAKAIVSEKNGRFPDTHNELLDVPGIGPYTAAAVASIAFNEDYPVVDGNVVRVLSRVLQVMESPKQKEVKAKLIETADQLLPRGQASDFNQAMMELGALICVPVKPKCELCPVSDFCQAYQTLDDPSMLPIKQVQKERPHYDIAVGVVWRDDKILISQRPANGLLGGLWEFPGGKLEPDETLTTCVRREIADEMRIRVKVGEQLMTVPHAYTHFRITLHAFKCRYISGEPTPKKAPAFRWLTPVDAREYAFPKSNKVVLDAINQGTI